MTRWKGMREEGRRRRERERERERERDNITHSINDLSLPCDFSAHERLHTHRRTRMYTQCGCVDICMYV